MLPWEVARRWQQENSSATFEETLGAHLSSGVVHSTPSVFILAHEVTWDPHSKEIVKGFPNAWFVELAAAANHANPVLEFLRFAQYPHQWALWRRQSTARKHDIHAYPWNRLCKRVGLQSV